LIPIRNLFKPADNGVDGEKVNAVVLVAVISSFLLYQLVLLALHLNRRTDGANKSISDWLDLIAQEKRLSSPARDLIPPIDFGKTS
jgi:hypothetical protein